MEGLEVWVEERIKELTENEIREQLKDFDAIVKTGKKWIKITIERENGKETLKLPFNSTIDVLHISVNGRYIGILEGRMRFAFINAMGICKTEHGSWWIKIVKRGVTLR